MYMDESEILQTLNITETEGVWVVIVDDEVVGKGRDLRELLDRARIEHPGKEPFVTTLPTKKAMLI